MYRRNQWRIIIPFLAPALILYLWWVIVPDLDAFWRSLHRWNGLNTMNFIGLDNFTKMLDDKVFKLALQHNAFFSVLTLISVTLLALFIAVALTGKIRAAGFFRTVYFFPVTISIVAIAAAWRLIYNPLWGPPTLFFNAIGQQTPFWLGDKDVVLWSVGAVMIWSSVGFHMTLYIAGIKNIPRTFYEAAQIDGASTWQEFRFITMPLLWGVIRISVAFLIIGGLNVFATVRILIGSAGVGLPDSVQVLATHMYEKAFVESFYGYGTAIAIVLFLLTMIVTLVSLFITRRQEIIEY
jgi:N-acetylglucosamine transport system permease protein